LWCIGRRAPRTYALALCLILAAPLYTGCASSALEAGATDHLARIERRSVDGLQVSAVVLSPAETEAVFGIPLAKKGVQPVWLEIESSENKEFVLQLLSIDPDYFSPSEVAWMYRRHFDLDQEEIFDLFTRLHVPVLIPPAGTVSGYVFTNLDPGAKAFSVEVFGENEYRALEFSQLVPGFEADFMTVDFTRLYAPEEVLEVDLEGLREYLEAQPCCVLGGDKATPGDPLNLVIVGEGRHMLATLVRQGWDLTETMRSDTAWRTATSSIFRSQYRTSPVSPLYLYGRSQDIALQKTRGSVDERNHLRLWLAPVTLKGRPVWLGQISRDIGVKLTRKTVVTHKIDPVVDEARLYVALDLAASQALSAVGYVTGVGASSRDDPRFNYTDDPYYTDGLRVVLLLADERQSLEDIEMLKWEYPGRTAAGVTGTLSVVPQD
jgi:hypothetical protein